MEYVVRQDNDGRWYIQARWTETLENGAKVCRESSRMYANSINEIQTIFNMLEGSGFCVEEAS
jgi:hypothetical protein